MELQKKIRVLILGGGISGLALAWYLSKRTELEIHLLEKEPKVGGHLQTDYSQGFLFERGARIFKVSRSSALLTLLDELDLSSKRIVSPPDIHHRYIWHRNTLYRVPTHLFALLSSPLTRPLLTALLTEWKKPVYEADESIWEFVLRRFNRQVAERLFDPLVLGMYAGDIRRLSMSACFPDLKRWEVEHGSVLRGLLASGKNKKNFGLPSQALFSLEGGVQTLIQRLHDRMSSLIDCGQEIHSLQCSHDTMTVETQTGCFQADHLFSAIPPYELARYLQADQPQLAASLTQIHFQDLAIVRLGFHSDQHLPKGFGYLVPSTAKEEILGAVFDSNLFPQQNSSQNETRLSVILAMNEGSVEQRALQSLHKHLHLTHSPDYLSVVQLKRAIPQYEVGHLDRMADLETQLANFCPRLHLVGNYFAGASVNDCIVKSKAAADNFLSTVTKNRQNKNPLIVS